MTSQLNQGRGRGRGRGFVAPNTLRQTVGRGPNATTQGVVRGTTGAVHGSGTKTAQVANATVTQGSGQGANATPQGGSVPGTNIMVRGTNSASQGSPVRGTGSTQSRTERGTSGRGSERRGSDALSTTRQVVAQENTVTNMERQDESDHDESDHDDTCDGNEDEPDVPVPPSNARKVCFIDGDRLVSDDDTTDATVSGIITQAIRKSVVENGFMWKNVPDSQQTIYFDEFKKYYTWTEDDAWIKETFLKHCARQYSRWLYRVKKASTTRGKPKVMTDHGWKLFLEYWDLEATKRKSGKMAANRNSGESKHCGGSCSTRCYKKKMTKELGREPDLFELMKKTHVKKDGSGYVDQKSKQIDEEVTARISTLKQLPAIGEGDSASQGEVEVNVDRIYLEVVGVKKQRVFGAGSLSHSITSKRKKVQHPSSMAANETVRTQIIEQAKAEMKEEMEEKFNAKLAAATEEMKAEMKADLMKTILEELRGTSAS